MLDLIRASYKHLCNLARVDDDAQRPVQILVDWHEHELLLENVNA